MFEFIHKLYRKCCRKENSEKLRRELIGKFLLSCNEGNISDVKEYMHLLPIETLRAGMKIASSEGNTHVVELLVQHPYMRVEDFTECLVIACKNTRYGVAEVMAKKGANLLEGIRNCTSQNILRMLNRQRNGVEMIQ